GEDELRWIGLRRRPTPNHDVNGIEMHARPPCLSEAAEAWAAAKATTSIPLLEDFVARYRDTFYCPTSTSSDRRLPSQEVVARKRTENSELADLGGTETTVAVATQLAPWREHVERPNPLISHVLIHEAGQKFGLSDQGIAKIEAEAD